MEPTVLYEKLKALHPTAILGSRDLFGSLEVLVDRKGLAEVVRSLRDDKGLAFDMLIDLVSIDLSLIPGWTGDRFAVNVLLKSLSQGHRLQLKATAPEDDPSFPTLSGLYANADWLEREAWDQMGLQFTGHPNLKRLLNHHEFVGHPLRKDYPITRRQWLSANESLMDEMDQRLKQKGFK
jgi:NADH:ubiquinone oxidoreductase subunit C